MRSAILHWPLTGAKLTAQGWTLDDTKGPWLQTVQAECETQIVCWWPNWPDFHDAAGCDSPLPPHHVYGFTGDVVKSLAVALCMIDLFAKWLSSEVATLAGGYWRLWGRHQLLTATDKPSIPLGIHISTMVGSGAEVWPKMLRAVMTLKHHESVSAVLAPDLLFSFDMMEVEKVPALASKWTWNLVHDRWEISPWATGDRKLKSGREKSMLIHSWTAVKARKVILSFDITL